MLSGPGIPGAGDVSLFLSGVFPDHATLYGAGPVAVARLLRAAQVPATDYERLSTVPAMELLEQLGARWYRAAYGLAPVRTARLDVVADGPAGPAGPAGARRHRRPLPVRGRPPGRAARALTGSLPAAQAQRRGCHDAARAP